MSYDSQDTVSRFATLRDITFPLLADEWGPTIKELGLTDPNMRKHHARYATRPLSYYRGVALPGVFVLDEDGVITDKRFHENRMERDAPATLLEEALNIAAPPPGAPQEAISDVVSARAYMDSTSYQRWQRHQLTVELEIEDGWHVYAPGTEPPYHALRLDVDGPDGVTAETPQWPQAIAHSLQGLDEEHMVHTGAIRLPVPITFGVLRGTGPIDLSVTVRFQACSSVDCLPPDSIAFDFTVAEAERVN